MSELKPCPFCGGEAEFVKNEFGLCDVMCKDIYCRGWSSCLETDDEVEAINAWNRRVGEGEKG